MKKHMFFLTQMSSKNSKNLCTFNMRFKISRLQVSRAMDFARLMNIKVSCLSDSYEEQVLLDNLEVEASEHLEHSIRSCTFLTF